MKNPFALDSPAGKKIQVESPLREAEATSPRTSRSGGGGSRVSTASSTMSGVLSVTILEARNVSAPGSGAAPHVGVAVTAFGKTRHSAVVVSRDPDWNEILNFDFRNIRDAHMPQRYQIKFELAVCPPDAVATVAAAVVCDLATILRGAGRRQTIMLDEGNGITLDINVSLAEVLALLAPLTSIQSTSSLDLEPQILRVDTPASAPPPDTPLIRTCAVLHIFVAAANDIPGLDASTESPSPYVEVEVESRSVRTATRYTTFNPVFQEAFSMPVINPLSLLTLSVFHEDPLTGPQLLCGASTSLPPTDGPPPLSAEMNIPMSDIGGKPAGTVTVRLQLEWTAFGDVEGAAAADRPVGCPWRCGKLVPLKELTRHLLVCAFAPNPTEIVACVHSDIGCLFAALREDVRRHVDVCPFAVVRDIIIQYRTDLADLRQTVRALTSENDRLRRDIVNASEFIRTGGHDKLSTTASSDDNLFAAIQSTSRSREGDEPTLEEVYATAKTSSLKWTPTHCIGELREHKDGVTALTAAIDHQVLFSGAADKTIKVRVSVGGGALTRLSCGTRALTCRRSWGQCKCMTGRCWRCRTLRGLCTARLRMGRCERWMWSGEWGWGRTSDTWGRCTA